jgi:hypothetical protein
MARTGKDMDKDKGKKNAEARPDAEGAKWHHSAADPLFALSIPERAVRSVLGTAGATAREVTHVVVPPALRRTRFWNAAVERSLGILAEGVGNVKTKKKGAGDVDVARMAVGSIVDTAALVVFQVSPLWLLAVVHDVASGSRNYLDEVVRELREKGALAKDVNIDNVDHLLKVLESTSGELQSDVDRPPLSVDELKKSVVRIRGAMSERPGSEVTEEAVRFARELEATSKAEGRSLREVSNAMAVGMATSARIAGKAAVAGVDVAARLFVEKGWNPWRDQLEAVRRMGFGRYLAHAAMPMARAIMTNFDPDTDTVTAQLLTGRLWKGALAKLNRKRQSAG